MRTFASCRRRSSRSCWRSLLLGSLVRSGVFAADRLLGQRRPAWRTPAAACCCCACSPRRLRSSTCSRRTTGLLHVLVSVFFLVQLLTTLTAVRDRLSHAPEPGGAAGLRLLPAVHRARVALLARTRSDQAGHDAVDGRHHARRARLRADRGAQRVTSRSSASALYLVGLVLMPTMPTVPTDPDFSGGATGLNRAASRARRAGPRPARASGRVRDARARPPASNCSVIRRVSCATSSSRARARSSRASRFSLARRMSSVSFMLRPTPRAAVVARPSEPTPMALRPKSAPRIVAPTERPGLELLLGGLRGFALDGCRRAPPLLVELRLPGRELLSHRIDRRIPRDSLRVAHAHLKITLALARVRGQLQVALAHQLELFGLRRATSRSPCSTRCSSLPAARLPAPPRRSRPPGAASRRSAVATSTAVAVVQSTASAPDPNGAA